MSKPRPKVLLQKEKPIHIIDYNVIISKQTKTYPNI
jgi:hypothetical protein